MKSSRNCRASSQRRMMFVFQRHDFVDGGKILRVALHEIVGDVFRRLLGIRQHARQMTAREVGVGVVSHSGTIRQQKRIGQAEITEPVAAQHRYLLPVSICPGIALQDPLKFCVEDVLADQPTSVVGESGQILEFTGEELFVIDIVSKLWLLQFLLELRRVVLVKFLATPNPPTASALPPSVASSSSGGIRSRKSCSCARLSKSSRASSPSSAIASSRTSPSAESPLWQSRQRWVRTGETSRGTLKVSSARTEAIVDTAMAKARNRSNILRIN